MSLGCLPPGCQSPVATSAETTRRCDRNGPQAASAAACGLQGKFGRTMGVSPLGTSRQGHFTWSESHWKHTQSPAQCWRSHCVSHLASLSTCYIIRAAEKENSSIDPKSRGRCEMDRNPLILGVLGSNHGAQRQISRTRRRRYRRFS